MRSAIGASHRGARPESGGYCAAELLSRGGSGSSDFAVDSPDDDSLDPADESAATGRTSLAGGGNGVGGDCDGGSGGAEEAMPASSSLPRSAALWRSHTGSLKSGGKSSGKAGALP